MICRRPENKARGLLWEFVGGKVEEGESDKQALIREVREELGVTVTVQDIFAETVHQYDDITVHLKLYNAFIAYGTPILFEHSAFRWITPAEIPQYEFCPADEEMLKKLMEK